MKIDPIEILLLPAKLEFIWNQKIPKLLRFVSVFMVCIAWIPFFCVLAIPMLLLEVWNSFDEI